MAKSNIEIFLLLQEAAAKDYLRLYEGPLKQHSSSLSDINYSPGAAIAHAEPAHLLEIQRTGPGHPPRELPAG